MKGDVSELREWIWRKDVLQPRRHSRKKSKKRKKKKTWDLFLRASEKILQLKTKKNKQVKKNWAARWGNVMKGWSEAARGFGHFSCPRSCACRARARRRGHCLGWSSLPPSGCMTMGPAGCSPCSQSPCRTPRFQEVCSPRYRRMRAPGTTDGGHPSASQWSQWRWVASSGCTASTSASGCAWERLIMHKITHQKSLGQYLLVFDGRSLNQCLLGGAWISVC